MLADKLRAATAGGAKIEYVGGYTQGIAGTTSNVTISLTSLTGGIASRPAAGDLVVVYFGTGSSADRNLVVSGYTEVIELYSNDTFRTNLAVAIKLMGATPDTSLTLTGGTLNVDDEGAVVIHVFRGVNQATPQDVNNSHATGTNSVRCDPTSITPVTSGAVIVAGGAGAHERGTQTFSSSDLTQFRSVGQGSIGDFCSTVGVGYHVWTSGAFNPAQFTFSGSDSTANSWAAVTLALRPA